MKRLLLAAGLALGLVAVAHAAIDTYEFASEAERQRYRTLVEELRCPKCQNQNIADSNAPIAMDLRDEVYQMVEAGKTDAQIIDFLVARYGDFVLYNPRDQPHLAALVRPGRVAADRLRGARRDRAAPPWPAEGPCRRRPLR